MKFCPSCGTKNEDDARFCENCGTMLEDVTEASTGADIEELSGAEAQGEEQAAGADDAALFEDAADDGAASEDDTQAWEEPVWEEQETGQYDPGEQYGQEQYQQYDPGERYGQEQYQQYDPGQQYGQEQYQQPQKPKRKMSMLQKVVIIEAVCLVAVIVAFFTIGNNRYSAKSVAESFVKAYAAHDWEKVYDQLELPEGGFIDESQFVEMMDKSEVPDITNYKVRAQAGASDGITRNFDVEYSVSGEGSSSMGLSVVKQSGKALFLFDNWKVSAEGMIVKDYAVTVPAGSKAAVDGVELTEDYLTAANQDGMDTYQLSLFSGIHTLNVAAPWCEVYEDEFDTSLDIGHTVWSLELSEAGKTAIQAKMQETLEKFYASAMAGADFSEVESLFATGMAEEYRDEYEDLLEDFADDGSSYYSYTVNQITFDNFDCDYYTDYGVIYGDMECDYQVDYTYTYTGFGTSRTENDTSDSYCYMSAGFVYEDDTYKLEYVSIPRVWW